MRYFKEPNLMVDENIFLILGIKDKTASLKLDNAIIN